MRRRAAFVLGLSLACRVAAGADSPPVAHDSRVRQALRLLEAWADGQQAYERLPGVPATAQTMYSICSISKPFTSITVMQLRDAGRLRLDDPVAGEHRFRRVRADGSLGEEVVFEMGPDGVPARMLRHSNYAVRVR